MDTTSKGDSGLRVEMPELMGMIVLVAGLNMLLLRQTVTGAIGLLVGMALILVRNPGSRHFFRRGRPTTYLNWVSQEATLLYERLSFASNDQFRSQIFDGADETSQLIAKLQLELPELFFAEVIAGAAHLKLIDLLKCAADDTNPMEVQIDGKEYRARSGLGRVFVAIAQDPRFKQLPSEEWIAGSQIWTLETKAK